ncbi:MAG: segregation/condensation protein A [Phycisphaerales bacterium]|nr:segregation/condensation protein A [Phycisphaerales bacterium]
MDYRVELDIYNGPLDLLLYLIKRDELDIHDIPIARITDSYMDHVHLLKEARRGGLDINVAGEFLVMAATLMEIKSAMLLPSQPPQEGEEPSVAQELADPRYELVQKLLEYKKFKDAALAMEQQAMTHAQRFARYPAREQGQGDELPPIDLEEVQVWDLLSAFNRLMSEVGLRKPAYHEVIYDDTPIDLHAADIEDRLNREKRLSLRQLITGRSSKSEMVGVFLALLELIRQKKVLIEQAQTFGEVEIVLAPEEHRRTGEQSSLHLVDESETQVKTRADSPSMSSDEAAPSDDKQPISEG